MNQERRAKIIKDHPNLFAYPRGTTFECEDGWLDIIEELCDKLEPIIIKHKQDTNQHEKACIGEPGGWPCVAQIKEKYAGLRFYMTNYLKELEEPIREAEEKSFQTCEMCGKPGSLRKLGGWIYTNCDECWGDKNE